MAEQLIITIDGKANVKIEAKGFTDSSCREATKPFEDASGIVTEDTLKVEAHVPAKAKEANRAYNG